MKPGASFTPVTVMVKVCGAEVSAPPPVVPPLSDSVSVMVAVPAAFAAGVKVRVPIDETAGATLKSAGLVFPVTLNVTVCPASSGGPALIAVAQAATVCAPASSKIDWLAPTVKLGTLLIGVSVIVNVCGADVSTPPPTVPPLSWATSVIVAVPDALRAGV